jgi:hypothetical protein
MYASNRCNVSDFNCTVVTVCAMNLRDAQREFNQRESGSSRPILGTLDARWANVAPRSGDQF